MQFLEQEFEGLPPAVKTALLEQLEFVVRRVVAAQRAKLGGGSTTQLTQDEACGIIFSIVDLASRLKHPKI